MFEKIMVCFDGSPGAQKALHKAAQLAKCSKAQIQAVWVSDFGPKIATVEKEARGEELREEMMEIERAEELSIPFHEISGTTTHGLLFYAQEQRFDLLVLGYSSEVGDPFGQNVSKIVPYVPCSVLVVR